MTPEASRARVKALIETRRVEYARLVAEGQAKLTAAVGVVEEAIAKLAAAEALFPDYRMVDVINRLDDQAGGTIFTIGATKEVLKLLVDGELDGLD